MKNTTITLLAFFLILFLVSCEDEEIDRGGIPDLRTLAVSDNNEEGVTMNGDLFFRGEGTIVEYGFVWSRNEDPTLENSHVLSESGDFDGGPFSLRTIGFLREEIRYYMRAFIRTNDIIVYGDIRQFTSNSTSQAVIQSFYPLKGSWGDSLYIKGSFFTYTRNYRLFLGGRELVKISIDDSLLVYRIPKVNNDPVVPLRLNFEYYNVIAEESFSYVTPKITSLSSNIVSFGDTLTVNAEGIVPSNSNVRIGSTLNYSRAQVIEFGENYLRVVIPDRQTTDNQLYLYSNGFVDSVAIQYVE